MPTTADALAGARDIVAEAISDHADIRRRVRDKALRFGMVVSEKVKDAVDEKDVFALYAQYEARVDRLKPYQVLALNRGEAGKILRVRLELAARDWREAVEREFRPDNRSPFAEQMALAIDDAANRLLAEAIAIDPRAEARHVRLGRTPLRQGRSAAARRVADRALALCAELDVEPGDDLARFLRDLARQG